MNIPAYNKSQIDEYYQDNLSQTLVNGLSDNGWTAPQQTTENITQLASTMPNGTIWYNSDTNSLQVLINGVVKTVTVS